MFRESTSHARVAVGRLARHGLLSISSQMIWGAQGFLTFLIAGRVLPEKELGFVVAANAILFGGQCLLLGPITNPTLRFGAISGKSVRVTYSIYGAVTVITCSTFVLLGAQMGRLIYADPAFSTLIRYLSVPFATTSLYVVHKLVLFARMRYKIVLMMDVLFTATNIAILIALHANAMLSSAIGFYMARSSAALAGLVPAVCVYALSRGGPVSGMEAHFSYKEYFQHSKYSFLSMLSGYGQGQVDALAVTHFLTPLGAATYGAAKIFYTGITMVTNGLVMIALPASSRITAAGRAGLSRLYIRALLLAYVLLLPSVAVLAAMTGPVLRICFGDRYPDAIPIVRIFCLAALVIPVSSITDAVANGAGWWRRACVAAITSGILGIVASLYLTRTHGLFGAALAPVLALGGGSCVIAWLTWGRLRTGSSGVNIPPTLPVELVRANEC